MNRRLVDNWNMIVEPDDTVYVLGDVSMTWNDEIAKYVKQLKGRKILIAGNHDKVWPSYKPLQVAKYLEAGFEQVVDRAYISINGYTVLLCHFPYKFIHPDDHRFAPYKPLDRGGWLLHGHTHQKEKRTGPKSIHVGVDAWYYMPISETEIINEMRKYYEE